LVEVDGYKGRYGASGIGLPFPKRSAVLKETTPRILHSLRRKGNSRLAVNRKMGKDMVKLPYLGKIGEPYPRALRLNKLRKPPPNSPWRPMILGKKGNAESLYGKRNIRKRGTTYLSSVRIPRGD
jgi:hypothetical protein